MQQPQPQPQQQLLFNEDSDDERARVYHHRSAVRPGHSHPQQPSLGGAEGPSASPPQQRQAQNDPAPLAAWHHPQATSADPLPIHSNSLSPAAPPLTSAATTADALHSPPTPPSLSHLQPTPPGSQGSVRSNTGSVTSSSSASQGRHQSRRGSAEGTTALLSQLTPAHRELFLLVDRRGSGLVDPEDCVSVFAAFGIMTEKELRNLFVAVARRTHDGLLDPHEFVYVVHRAGLDI